MGMNCIIRGENTKAKYWLEKAAMKGSIEARHMLGHYENEVSLGGRDRMLKHFKIAARAGYEPSMKCLKEIS